MNIKTTTINIKNTKVIPHALVISIGVHVLLVFLMIGLYKTKPILIEDLTFLEISEMPKQRAIRTLKRKNLSPPKFTPIKQEQIENVVSTHIPTLSKTKQIIHRNPITPLRGFSLPEPRTLGMNNAGINAPVPSISEGIATGYGLGRFKPQTVVRNVTRNSFMPLMDDTLASIGDLPLPNVILARIGQHIVTNRTKDVVDIVFIIDGSGSMKDNINAVRNHLNRMTDLFDVAQLDFTIGIVIFRNSAAYNMLGWDFEVIPQTRSVLKIRRALTQVKCRGGEKAVDALIRAADEVQYRKNADVHFILITDEYVSGNYTASDVLQKMKKCNIKVDVVGLDEPFQKFITRTTGGIWLPIASLGIH